ncbi:MAG: general secretion pathway protein GspM [Burkholderiales bacterium RIFCSPLOWO2_02_FULL_57_36]|nr:MAG: general secretion pathway protein GspM [Burkholderiales bacterium RIFCSPLOWO2_02_FULL_57_36]
MNLTSRLNEMTQPLSAFWSVRNARERALLAAAMIVIVLGLIYLLLIDPAITGRERLNKSLPVLRQQVAELQAMSKEASSLSARTAPTVAPLSRESLETALVRKGLKPQNLALTGDGIARVQLTSVSFAGVIDWLDDMQKTALLSVIEANITALPEAGQVNANLTLQQRKSE